MKRILDSVHGYIHVGREYIKEIVDTPYFQRLRRVEQTSARSVFPSARHDRFIHSLGVFHLGCKIVDHLCDSIPEDAQTHPIYESYRLACLLHDVAHSPFSHTFEKYFDNQWSDLRGDLKTLIGSPGFASDWDHVQDPSAPHERMSAIVAVGIYGGFIAARGADKELVARMIIGLKYSDHIRHSLENAMIELIHGDVIDADGLDYACRDTWASGYSTTSIDVDRLIDAIVIEPDATGLYQLSFTAKCLNEIESVLRVKTFQQFYVINHHTIAYEQRLLVKAMESAAQYHFYGHVNDDENEREIALQQLCNIKAYYDVRNPLQVGITTATGIHIALPKDDDFVSLMNYIPDEKYVSQWQSRKYALKPLWKSKAEFYYHFDELRDVQLLKESWIFSDDCRTFISARFGIPVNDLWKVRATAKYKGNYAESVSIHVNGTAIPYTQLFPKDIQSYEPPRNEFYYWYVPQEADKDAILQALKDEYVKFFMQR